MARQQVRYGIVGVKGFSQRHVLWIRRAAAAGAPVSVAAAATIFDDPDALAAGDVLARDGVKVVRSYDDLLSLHGEIDIVTLPVGINLHAPLAEKALAAGFTAYVEKPPAGTVEEIARMRDAEKASSGRLFVGFQTIYQPSTWILKRRLLEGVVGKLRRIVTTVAWPRPMTYYHRNRWAGKVEIDGAKIYDCPMNNSAAHFLNAMLFLAGASEEASATPVGVKAELYRVAPIQSADNTFARFATKEGVDVVFNASHCVQDEKPAFMDIVGDRGRIEIVDQEERVLMPWTVVAPDGTRRVEGEGIPRAEVFERVAAAYLDPGMKEISTLATAANHTLANQMAFAATPIRDIDPGFVTHRPWKLPGDEIMAVNGMNEALEFIRKDGLLPSEAAKYGWAAPAGELAGSGAGDLFARLRG